MTARSPHGDDCATNNDSYDDEFRTDGADHECPYCGDMYQHCPSCGLFDCRCKRHPQTGSR